MCRLEIIDVFVSHYFIHTNISKSYQFKLSDFPFCCYFDWVNVVACACALARSLVRASMAKLNKYSFTSSSPHKIAITRTNHG